MRYKKEDTILSICEGDWVMVTDNLINGHKYHDIPIGVECHVLNVDDGIVELDDLNLKTPQVVLENHVVVVLDSGHYNSEEVPF